MDQLESTQSVETPSTTSSQENTGGEVTSPVSTSGETPQESAPPAPYQPNFKYKIKDKEFEFDKRFQAYIKSKEDEDNFRDLFTKHHGFDEIKTSRDNLQSTVSELETFKRGAERLFKLKDYDLGAFFDRVKLDDESIYKYLTSKYGVEGAESPNQKGVEAFERDIKNEELESFRQTSLQQNHQLNMRLALMNPEVQSFMAAWDAKASEGMRFEDLVNEFGSAHHARTGEYIEPHEAVSKVMQRYRSYISQESTQPQTNTPLGVVNPEKSNIEPLPTIGKGAQATPVSKKFKHFSEVRKHASGLKD